MEHLNHLQYIKNQKLIILPQYNKYIAMHRIDKGFNGGCSIFKKYKSK